MTPHAEDRPAGYKSCPRCGARFVCDHEAGRAPCWCAIRLANLFPVPGPGADCLCPDCLGKEIDHAPEGKTRSP